MLGLVEGLAVRVRIGWTFTSCFSHFTTETNREGRFFQDSNMSQKREDSTNPLKSEQSLAACTCANRKQNMFGFFFYSEASSRNNRNVSRLCVK